MISLAGGPMNNENDMKELLCGILCNELYVLRAKARVSQEEIADRIGVSRQTYSAIETGRRTMSWTTFLALIAYFQKNENTKDMLNNLDGLVCGLEQYVVGFHDGHYNR